MDLLPARHGFAGELVIAVGAFAEPQRLAGVEARAISRRLVKHPVGAESTTVAAAPLAAFCGHEVAAPERAHIMTAE